MPATGFALCNKVFFKMFNPQNCQVAIKTPQFNLIQLNYCVEYKPAFLICF